MSASAPWHRQLARRRGAQRDATDGTTGPPWHSLLRALRWLIRRVEIGLECFAAPLRLADDRTRSGAAGSRPSVYALKIRDA
jgi:hypothetical protein